jgi:DNA-binding response OmpR family regulator
MPAVLIVESGASEREALTERIASAGFSVRACSDVVSARRALEAEAFAVAVVRTSLPDGSCRDVMHYLAKSGRGSRTAVVVLTSDVEAREKTPILRAGVALLIGGPLDAARVAREVASLASVGRPSAAADDSGHVLLVDDSATYAYALINELEKDGHEITLAQSGAEALAFLAVQRVAILVLDVFLPDMNGIELCRRIRAMPQSRTTRILILTGRKNSVVKESAVEAGADDFAVKARDLVSIRERVLALRKGPASERDPSSRQKVAAANALQQPVAAADANPAAADSPTIHIDRVIAASGLSALIGRQAIVKAFARAGVDGPEVSPEDLDRVLPHIERTLRLFLGEDDARDRMKRIEAMKVAAAASRRGGGEGLPQAPP